MGCAVFEIIEWKILHGKMIGCSINLLPIVQFSADGQLFQPINGGLQIMMDRNHTTAIVPKTNFVVLLRACSIGSDKA